MSTASDPVSREKSVGARDPAVIAGQLGRRPHDLTGVAARCPFGYPAVIETAPVLTGGSPNPTLLYLTCPTLTTVVSRAEAGGAVRAFKSWIRTDPDAQLALVRITRLYRERRAALAGSRAPDARLDAGIGGPQGPEKASCLHAYAAALLAVISGWLGGASAWGEPVADGPGARATRGDLPEAHSLADHPRPEHAPPAGTAEPPDDQALARWAQRIWARSLPEMELSWCADIRCSRRVSGEKRAAIDVGTISVRLLVAEIAEGQVRTIVRRAEVTRLGEGLLRGGWLTPAARRRTAAVVGRYVQQARSQDADWIVVAGTSAAREATDGSEYILELGRENEVPAVVLTGREEAELAYTGATLDVSGDMVALDVGGGSTELIRRSREGAVDLVSLELGASRATERWVKSDPPTPGEIESIYEEAERAVGRLRDQFGGYALAGQGSGAGPGGEADLDRPDVGAPLAAPGLAPAVDIDGREEVGYSPNAPRLVGVAGTVTTLACLDAGLKEHDAEALHLRILTVAAVRGLVMRLSAMDMDERAALPCVQKGRAPVIVAGAVILLATMETLGYEELTVSERDLLDGLVLRGQAIMDPKDATAGRANV